MAERKCGVIRKMSKMSVRTLWARQFPFFLSVPGLIWQVLFFFIPVLLVIGMSIAQVSGYGLTLEHYRTVFSITYISVILRSLVIAFITALLCLILAYPVCYYLAVHVRRAKNALLFFLILPFWTSALVQIYAWFFVLERHGLINTLLQRMHLIEQPIGLLNTQFAVYLVMIYCYLPFMIMPLYAQIEKLDRRLIEASADLGASSWQTFVRITLPLSLPGIQTGFFLVFVPSFGEVAIPSLVSGGKELFVGSLISQFFMTTDQSQLGAAFTVLSCIALVIAVALFYAYFAWLVKRPRSTIHE